MLRTNGDAHQTELLLYEVGVLVRTAARHLDLLLLHDVGRGHQVLLEKAQAGLDVFGLELDKVQAVALRHFVLGRRGICLTLGNVKQISVDMKTYLNV